MRKCHCERSAAIQPTTAARRILASWIAASLTFLAMTGMVYGADTARKPIPQQDITKQETVVLGNSRFLIFSGTAASLGQYGYTVDLVKIEGGIPRFDPLFVEEYHADTNTAKLEYGVAFMALSYKYDKNDASLNYTTLDPDTNDRLQLRYKLDVDIFKLEEVIIQKHQPCPKEPCPLAAPQTIFKASANAQAH